MKKEITHQLLDLALQGIEKVGFVRQQLSNEQKIVRRELAPRVGKAVKAFIESRAVKAASVEIPTWMSPEEENLPPSTKWAFIVYKNGRIAFLTRDEGGLIDDVWDVEAAGYPRAIIGLVHDFENIINNPDKFEERLVPDTLVGGGANILRFIEKEISVPAA